MSNLMVSSESFFRDCRVTSVAEERGGRCLVVGVRAERADWFAPEAEGAGPDGWLRGVEDLEATMRFTFAADEHHRQGLERARRWQASGQSLSGFADLEHQASGLFVQGSRDPDDYLVCRMDPALLDRP